MVLGDVPLANIATGSAKSLLDGIRDFVGFSKSVAILSFSVSDNDKSGEADTFSAFNDLGDAGDLDDFLVIDLFPRTTASAAIATGETATALGGTAFEAVSFTLSSRLISFCFSLDLGLSRGDVVLLFLCHDNPLSRRLSRLYGKPRPEL